MLRVLFIFLNFLVFSIAQIQNFTSFRYEPEWYDFLNHQSILVEDLFKNYDPTVAPVYTRVNLMIPYSYDPNAPKPFNYTIRLYYLKLLEVHEPGEKISLVMEMAEQWYDPRLVWEPEKYGNIDMIHLRQQRVWSPTLTGFGINDIIDFRDQDFRLASVESNGRISTFLSVRVSSNCEMNVENFPYDFQTCSIQFYMPIFYERHIEMHIEIYEGIANQTIWNVMGNSEWDLLNLTSRVDHLSFHDGMGNNHLATIEIKIKRNPWYYIYMIVFPSFIINFLSIIGVFMRKTELMDKLNVGLTNVMTMTFILGVMADKIPRTGYVPLLGIYLIVNLLIMILSVAVTICIGGVKRQLLPVLKSKEYSVCRKLEFLLEEALEIICTVLFEFLTLSNFSLMIWMWFRDS